MNQFIKTSDDETKARLRALGFIEIDENINKVATFLNDEKKPLLFEGTPLKVTYSNILCV